MQRQYFPIALSHIIICFKPGQVLDPVFYGSVQLFYCYYAEKSSKAKLQVFKKGTASSGRVPA